MTMEDKIKKVCRIQGISLSELGRRVGLQQSVISRRVKTGKFTQEELAILAKAMGCKYHSYFEFPDGERV